MTTRSSVQPITSLILLSLFLTAGCSRSGDGRMRVYPVSGKVTANGQPVAGAHVAFYGATPDLQGPGTVGPSGTTDESGQYRLRSYDPDDGAPAGKFNVTVFWPEPTPPGADEMYQPKDRLKGRYADPKSSGLTAEVPEGGGELPPLELKLK